MRRHLALAWLSLGSSLLILIPFTVLSKDGVKDSRSNRRVPVMANLGVAVLPLALNLYAINHLLIAPYWQNVPTATTTAPSSTFTVINTNDSGLGSLRDAIDQANVTPGIDLINFTAGLGTINVGSTTGVGLPDITEAVTIDGGSPRVELNGAAAGGATGLHILAAGVTVRSLVINRFSLSGISLQADNCIVQDNFIGTDATGTSALPNAGGLLLDGANNLIGGSASTARNIISGNSGFGIQLNSAAATNNTIQGNFIGTDVTGVAPLGNGGSGVRCLGGASNNTFGGTVFGAGNTVAFNGAAGINLFAGSNNGVLGNSIFSNAGIGIDLSDDGGVTPNDPCDPDVGANNLQNFPALTSASSGGSTNIIGSLDSTLATTFRIEFFSSPTCDGSGFGEGQTFIGATAVNVSGNACVVPFNATFPVAVPVGSVITATATDPSNNTSEFSQCVSVVAAPPCTVTCPPDLFATTSPIAKSCAATVTYSPDASAGCGSVICSPPSGSLFAVGTTTVVCAASGGPTCSFGITVVDATPPILSCPINFSAPLPIGQLSAVVNYPTPSTSDNCSGVSVVCVPPPGSTFPAGDTLVTCSAIDFAENSSRCFFFVSVLDSETPVIRCPTNVGAVPAAGQTSAVVNYPPPTVIDNLPGVNVLCSPPSGSSFPTGVTTVTCTATDAAGNRSSCVFSVNVGGPQIKVTIPGNKPAVDFAASPVRKPPKPKNSPCSLFAIENVGFAPLVLTLDSIARTGSDVDSGRITEPNDPRFFSISLVNPDQSLTSLDIGGVLTLQPGQVQNLCAKFFALIPALAGKTSGLSAANVLPDTLTSKIVFRPNAGNNLSVPLLSRVSTALVLVNLADPRTPPEVSFTRSGNEITVSYAVFDSNLDVSRAKYELVDDSGQVVAGPFEIDLGAPIRSANLVKGQSFSVEQRFIGASSNPQVTGVRLTVFDGETSVSASSSGSKSSISAASIELMNRARRATLYLPDVTLDRQRP